MPINLGDNHEWSSEETTTRVGNQGDDDSKTMKHMSLSCKLIMETTMSGCWIGDDGGVGC